MYFCIQYIASKNTPTVGLNASLGQVSRLQVACGGADRNCHAKGIAGRRGELETQQNKLRSVDVYKSSLDVRADDLYAETSGGDGLHID